MTPPGHPPGALHRPAPLPETRRPSARLLDPTATVHGSSVAPGRPGRPGDCAAFGILGGLDGVKKA